MGGDCFSSLLPLCGVPVERFDGGSRISKQPSYQSELFNIIRFFLSQASVKTIEWFPLSSDDGVARSGTPSLN